MSKIYEPSGRKRERIPVRFVRNISCNFTVNRLEKAFLEKMAKAEKITLSTYCRRELLEKKGYTEPEA